jgi:hypothetical protein
MTMEEGRQKMLDWHQQVLAAARQIDPSAYIGKSENDMPAVVFSGGRVELTTPNHSAFVDYGVTPEQQVQSSLTGTPVSYLMDDAQKQRVQQAQVKGLDNAVSQLPLGQAQSFYAGMAPSANGVKQPVAVGIGDSTYPLALGTSEEGKPKITGGEISTPSSGIPYTPTSSAYPVPAPTSIRRSDQPTRLSATPYDGLGAQPASALLRVPTVPSVASPAPASSPLPGSAATAKRTTQTSGSPSENQRSYYLRDLLRGSARSSGYGKF